MKRKGIIGAQFNWIFAIIAGALILSLVVGFIFKQKQISDERTYQNNLNEFQSVLASAKLTEGRIETLKLDPRIDFRFDCEANVLLMGSMQEEVGADIVAGPRSLSGMGLYLWTKPAMTPAHIANLIFLSPSTKYYFFVTNDFADKDVKELYDEFPNSIKKMLLKPQELEENVKNILKQQDAKIRIIYIGVPVQNKAALSPNRVSEIKLNLNVPSTAEFNNEIYSLYYDSSIKSMMPQIAVLADNGNDYDCTISRIFKKGVQVYEILKSRASNLRAYYLSQNQQECANIFSQAMTEFEKLKNSINMQPDDLLNTQKQLENLYGKAESSGCANLY